MKDSHRSVWKTLGSIGNRLTAAAGDWDTSGQTPVFDPDSATAYSTNVLNQYDAITTDNTPFTPSHDDDGNQKDAQILPLGASEPASCVYHWDAENRLTSVTTPGGAVLASFAYDVFSRLISRSVGVSPTTTTAYFYNGWNRIAEYEINNQNSTIVIRKSYLWGPDLSGTFQGAGGVGGLLSVNTIGGSVHYPAFDGNGNITEYLTAAGAVAAHFEYDPFGNTVASTDTTNQFEYRFSTKPIDGTTGLYYYGYRWYDPLTGRWPARDPIGEEGGVNLYGFVGNDGVDLADVFGLKSCEELVDSTVRHSLLEVAKDLRSVRKLTTEEALDEAQYVADFEVIKNNIKKLCCCGETFRQLLDWFSSIHAPNEEHERKVITVFTQAQQERRSGEGTRGDSAGGIVTVVPDAKLPLTVAHEITHATRGETDLPLPLAKKLKDAERDIEDADGDYRSEYQARMMERIIANESVTKCNYYIESYPYYGLKKIPHLPPALKLDPTKPGGTNPDMRRDPKSKRLVTEVDEISRTHPYVKVRL